MSDEGGSVALGSNSVEWPGESLTELLAGISSVGGGRGVFAKIDIGPGQLVLVERPLVTVPDDKFPEVSRGPSLSSSYGSEHVVTACACLSCKGVTTRVIGESST